MRPYVIQNFRNDRGEVSGAKLLTPGGDGRRCELAGAEITLSPEAGVVYACGTLSALTLSDYPESGAFAVTFSSGAEPTVLTVPLSLAIPEDFDLETNTRYELNVRDGYALCAGWAVNGDA